MPLPPSWASMGLMSPQPLLASPSEFASPSRKVKPPQQSEENQEEFYNLPLAKIVPFKGGKKAGQIGLEIEVEGKQLFSSPFRYWSCHSDGSLRETDGHPAVEYVLKEPLADLETLHKALMYLESKLSEAGSSVVMSNRTSVHVHINVQQYTVKELYCFILLYLIFEEVLIDCLSPDRAGNLFCLRAKDTDFYLHMLESALNKQNFRDWREDMRYSACNVASVVKFGSLEFRALKGTVDVGLIEMWVGLLVALRDRAKQYDNPVDIVEDFTRLGPLPFFRQTFTEENQRKTLGDTTNLSGKLWDGLRMMRDVAYTVNPWKQAKKKKDDQEKPEQSNKPYLRTDEIFVPGFSLPRMIESKWDRPGVEWSVRVYNHATFEVGPRELFSIPVGWTMYYFVDNINFDSDFIIVDLREGPPE